MKLTSFKHLRHLSSLFCACLLKILLLLHIMPKAERSNGVFAMCLLNTHIYTHGTRSTVQIKSLIVKKKEQQQCSMRSLLQPNITVIKNFPQFISWKKARNFKYYFSSLGETSAGSVPWLCCCWCCYEVFFLYCIWTTSTKDA